MTSADSVHGPAVQKQNITNAQRLKLLMHERCNHHSMETISAWISCGLLPVDPSVASCPHPICASCQAGKAHRKSYSQADGSITKGCLKPGDGVSADQLDAGHAGRIPTTKGLPTTKRYRYCNIWVDH
jgi:hypothetical protein